jgi:hypothetical protein
MYRGDVSKEVLESLGHCKLLKKVSAPCSQCSVPLDGLALGMSRQRSLF